ncbi:MAG: Radical domain protein, partial [Bryobacterales bacterium]|nr:Radical domain protein [Bryobacterales bacterium]
MKPLPPEMMHFIVSILSPVYLGAMSAVLTQVLTPLSRTFPPLGGNIKALMVWPKFPPSFWGFEGVLEMIPERSMTPPLGLITVAALCPATWNIRLIDCAFEELRDEDLQWADLVMVSAMHAQRVYARAVLG